MAVDALGISRFLVLAAVRTRDDGHSLAIQGTWINLVVKRRSTVSTTHQHIIGRSEFEMQKR